MTSLHNMVRISALTLLCVGLVTSKASGDFIITVQNVSLATGSTGSINVSIESNANNNLDLFQYKFAISANSGSVGVLRFTDPQSNSELSLGNYIHTDSDGFVSQAQNSPAFDTILGGDFTLSGNGTDVTSEKTLVRLDVEHILPVGTPLSASFADSYVISLVQDVDTFFFSSNSNPVNVLSANSGLVSITAVPEPSSVLLVFIVGLLALLSQRRKDIRLS